MRSWFSLLLGLALLLPASRSHADNTLYAVDLECVRQAKASITVMVHFASGDVRTFPNRCLPNGRAIALWPDFRASYGDVVALSVQMHVSRSGQPSVFNACDFRSGNGYLVGECLVDEDVTGDRAKIFFSIPHAQP